MEIQHQAKRAEHAIAIPNLVELQLDSFRWFLEEGLPELFQSFSPIYDFTGQTAIELIDFTLGEPKHSLEQCRSRDVTFESPIKARVRLNGPGQEVIESEVYLGMCRRWREIPKPVIAMVHGACIARARVARACVHGARVARACVARARVGNSSGRYSGNQP